MTDHLGVPDKPNTREQAYLAAILHELKAIRALLQPVELQPVVEAKPKRPARKAKA